jgi:pimeloyl-ACP methyl ester carboxylesterase
MLRTISMVALMTAVAFAGCTGTSETSDLGLNPFTGRDILAPDLRASLSVAQYEIEGHYDVTFEGQTGIQLYMDYYLPTTPEGQEIPTILVFTPYQGGKVQEGYADAPATGASSPDDTPFVGSIGPDDYIVDAPYRAALVEEYTSYGYAVAFADVRGTHRAGGCTDQTGPDQWTDGYDYVEWLGAQEWSNGKVGMWGVSYDGETQTTTAFRQPPSLATIVPVAAVSSQYEWLIYQGVPLGDAGPGPGMAGYAAGSAEPSYAPEDAALYGEKFECQDEAFTDGSDTSGDYTPFWETIDYRPHVQEIDVPVLLVQGFDDYVVRSHQATPFFDNIQSEKRAILGQWTHALPDREDWGGILHAWYDYHLLSIENGIMDILPPVLAEDNNDQWWGMDEYQASERDWLELELSGDGKLVTPGNAVNGQFEIRDYPSSEQEETLAMERRVEFKFTPDQDYVMFGRPELDFTAASSAVSTHWGAFMLNGTEVTANCLESGNPYYECVNYGYQDTRHRDGLDNPKDLTPGEQYQLNILFSTQFEVLKAGVEHTLVLTNNGPDMMQDPTDSTNTIYVGGANAATLRIPLMPASAISLPENELPEVYPGFLPASE